MSKDHADVLPKPAKFYALQCFRTGQSNSQNSAPPQGDLTHGALYYTPVVVERLEFRQSAAAAHACYRLAKF